MSKNRLDEIRAVLDRHQANKVNGVGHISRLPTESCDRFWIGFLHGPATPFLRVEVDRNEIPSIDPSKILTGIEFFLEENDGPGLEFNFDIILKEVQYRDLFVYFMNDIVQKVESLKDNTVRTALTAAIELWKSFLSNQTRKRLSDNEIQGLWGEIWFLGQLITHTPMSGTAVDYWFGPDKEIHDFAVNGKGVEVKTHSSPGYVTITNEWQLDPGSLELSLCSFLVRRSRVSGFTLPSLVDQTRRLLEKWPLQLQKFDSQLLTSGYFEIDRQLYESISFDLKEIRVFSVKDDFPGIRYQHLPEGVDEVQYRLNLASCVRWESSFDILINSMY